MFVFLFASVRFGIVERFKVRGGQSVTVFADCVDYFAK